MRRMRMEFQKKALAAVMMVLCVTFATSRSNNAESGGISQNRFRVPELTIEKTEKMVDVGGRQLHCILYGQGAQAIILLNGFNAPQETWNAVIPALAETATVMTYDRAGIGQSEIGDLPTHGKQSAQDLDNLLARLELPKPYVLVGHSYGVRIARLYASMFPGNVGGIVLLDGQHPDILDEQKKVLSGADLEQLGKMVEMMKPRGNPRVEMDYVYESLEQDKKIKSLPQVPCVVVTAGARREGGMPPGFSVEAQEKLVKIGLEMQEKLLEDIPGGKHVIIEDAGHFMHLEKPEKVIAVILDLISEVRKQSQDIE